MHVIEIKIRDGDVHRNRNFGEDLWRVYRGERGVGISLDEIDRAIDSISIKVGRRASVRLVLRKMEHHLERHKLTADIEVRRE